MLSLCMIVRDSSRTLGACLQSIAPWVDELIVVDTGSQDDTRTIAKSFGAKVFEFPWCDSFAAARNESLKHAIGDWLFWMDSDDTISSENGKKLRALADRPLDEAPTAYIMQVHCPGPSRTGDVTVVDHVKLFRNDPRLRFEGRIHEQILPAIRRIDGTLEWTDVFVTHSGSEHSEEAKRHKQGRDLRLLELELAEKPEHTFVLFNLGMTYADMNEPTPAVEFLKRSLLAASPDESHVRKAYSLLISCLVQLEQDDEALRIVQRALEMFPDDAELLFRKGILCHRASSYEQAIAAFEEALENRAERHFASRDQGITGYKARHNLALIYREINRPDLAEYEWRTALNEVPNYEVAWRGLTEVLLEQKKLVTLQVEIENRQSSDLSERELACAAIRCHLATGEAEVAKQKLSESLQNWPDDVELLRFACEFLFHHGEPEDCLDYLVRLCSLDPNDAAAWHNLGSTHQRVGRFDDAVCCLERSLALRQHAVGTILQLAEAYRAIGAIQLARDTLLKALKVVPNDQHVQQALANLEYSLTGLAP